MPRKRLISILLSLLLLLQLMPFNVKAAATIPERPVINTSDALYQPATGYNADDGYYADINWSDISYDTTEWKGRRFNVYIQEISKTGVPGDYTQKLTEVTSTNARLRNLKSGTVYNVYVTSYLVKYNTNGDVIQSSESEKSNIVTIMTDIQVYASPYGSKQLKIEWDDVWMSGSRISYNIYIADDSGFSGTQPIPVSASQIGADGKVNVNQAAGRLTYIHTVADSGRVYYVKIKPQLGSLPVFYNPESKVVASSSFILVKTTKMYDTDSGTVWKLDWSEVAVAFEDIKISYQIYKVDVNNNNLAEYMLSVDNNSTYLTVTSEDANNYYIIKALVTDRLGNDIYKDWNVTIQSDKIYLKDSEIPAVPTAPEIVNELILPPDTVVESYTDSLKPDSASILWKLPRTGAGDIDYDVSYDIWLITDPLKLDDPDNTSLVAQDVKLSDILVKSEASVIGAKYQLSSLVPNSTYYFRIVAKKSYVEYVDGNVEDVTLSSQPSTKLVITPPRENGDTPVAVDTPPMKVKLDDQGNKIVGATTATLSMKNKWYEKYNTTDKRWEYINPVLSDGTVLTDETVENDVYGTDYRIVEYDGGVTINVGAAKVSDLPADFENYLNDNTKYPTTFLTGVAVTPNDSTENAGLNPDGKKHNVDINLTGLEANTTYVIWVRAARTATGVISNASDPIYITTTPDGGYIPEKPTVPNFNYGYAGDTYVDLGWAYNTNYIYNIKYSKGEDLEKAEGSVTVKGSEMVSRRILTIPDLEQSTNYYFWIQAEYQYNGQNIDSDFGDAYHLMTTEFTPPATPYGFGIKGGSGSVTKSSITYEWMTTSGLEYILEIADNINYTDSTLIQADSASEYTVTGLKSNTRYYARLYAYNSQTQLKSEPTQSVIAKTLKSKDDYDTDEDTDTIISGDFIVKDSYAAGQVWNVSITGVNADRFLEDVKNGSYLDYIIDLKNPPSSVLTTNVTISAKVFTEMSKLGRTITFSTEDYSISFGPGTLDFDTYNRDVYTNYVIALSSGVKDSTVNPYKIDMKTKIGRIDVKRQEGTGYINILNFGKPVLISYNLTDSTWYDESNSFGFVLDNNVWRNTESTFKQDSLRGRDFLKFNTQKPCDFLAGQQTTAPYSDVLGNWASDYIKKLSAKVELKSVQGSYFRPDSYARIDETVKMVFDTAGYNYSSNYLQEAYRAGLIDRNDAVAPGSYCTTEKAIYMLMTIYERNSGETLTSKGSAANMFEDMDSVSGQYRDKVYFAVENGMYAGKDKYRLNPTSSITRGELAAILVKYLEFKGEL